MCKVAALIIKIVTGQIAFHRTESESVCTLWRLASCLLTPSVQGTFEGRSYLVYILQTRRAISIQTAKHLPGPTPSSRRQSTVSFQQQLMAYELLFIVDVKGRWLFFSSQWLCLQIGVVKHMTLKLYLKELALNTTVPELKGRSRNYRQSFYFGHNH